MKKIILALVVLGILESCGPHRAKCGVGRRCLVLQTSNTQNTNFS